ncbi:MAG: YidC/Oxa1 family membrane protein insertase [Clostridia bacterium]|nr:YidC/Oxa1 family membrane protein insertase [Clostridia bacterium]
MFAPIYSFFGAILHFFYNLFGNYGLALIGFTFVVNIVLLPLTWKQQKSTTKMQAIQPELTKIQEKYKNDKEKLNTEMMKLYQDNNINPMSGCLPLLIQLPIIFILYRIVYSPITHMLGYTAEQLAKLQAEHPEVTGAMAEVALAAKSGLIDFNFYGLDLSLVPSIGTFNWLWLIPIFAGITTYGLSWLTMRQAEAKKTEAQKQKEKDNPTASQMQTMNKIMPLITVWFAFTFSASIGLYWIMNNIFKMIQQLVVNQMLKKEGPLVIEANTGNKKKKKK